MSVEKDDQWQATIGQHSEAVRAFVHVASKIDSDAWSQPASEGKWSPAEITEHLNLVYEGFLHELREGSGIRIHTNWLVRCFLRLAILPRIFDSGQLPNGAKSPPEVKPTGVNKDQAQALAQFPRLAEEFQTELVERNGLKGTQLTHHIFGHINALEGLRFVTIHIAHHQKQLP